MLPQEAPFFSIFPKRRDRWVCMCSAASLREDLFKTITLKFFNRKEETHFLCLCKTMQNIPSNNYPHRCTSMTLVYHRWGHCPLVRVLGKSVKEWVAVIITIGIIHEKYSPKYTSWRKCCGYGNTKSMNVKPRYFYPAYNVVSLEVRKVFLIWLYR